MGIAGPHLTVAGATFCDRLTTQRLTDYVYLGPRPSHEGKSGLEEGIREVAHILRALEISNKSLREYYLNLNTKKRLIPPSKDGPMPPSFRTFTTEEGSHKLRYMGRLAEGHLDKVVFVATVEPPREAGKSDVVVVKFTHSYCEAAHRLLSGLSLAPCLQYCEKVESVGMYVVIMDFVVANTLGQNSSIRASPASYEPLSKPCTMRDMSTVIFESRISWPQAMVVWRSSISTGQGRLGKCTIHLTST